MKIIFINNIDYRPFLFHLNYFKIFIAFLTYAIYKRTIINVERSTMRIFYINIFILIKTINMYSLAIHMKYFLKGNKLSEILVI